MSSHIMCKRQCVRCATCYMAACTLCYLQDGSMRAALLASHSSYKLPCMWGSQQLVAPHYSTAQL
jgi:cytochrome c